MVPGIKVICPDVEEMEIINEACDGQDLLYVPLIPTMFRTAGSYILNGRAEMIKNNYLPNCKNLRLNWYRGRSIFKNQEGYSSCIEYKLCARANQTYFGS